MWSPIKVIGGWGIPKVRLVIHAVLGFVTAGIWIPAAVLLEVYVASSRDHKRWSDTRLTTEKVLKLEGEIHRKENDSAELLKARHLVEKYAEANSFTEYKFDDVILWESRERVTSTTSGTTMGKTRTGSVGLGWSDGIGWAASQGVTRGTIASQTSEVRTNEFTELDEGVLRIDREFVAFIGNQFSRTGNYNELLAIQDDYVDGIGFSVLNAEKIWVIKFSSNLDKRIAQYLIGIAHALATGATSSEVWTRADQDFEAETSKINQEIEELRRDILALQAKNVHQEGS